MLRQAFLAFVMVMVLGGEAHADALPGHGGILVIGPDVQLSERSAAGDALTRPDWSQAAQQHITQSLQARLSEAHRTIQFVNEDVLLQGQYGQLLRLHALVADAALNAQGRRGSAPRWSIGEGAQNLANAYHADYALIVGCDGVYGSAPRDMLAFASSLRTVASAALGNPGAAAALGIHAFHPSASGRRIAASLIDLHTGDIIWIRQADAGRNDPRSAQGARRLLGALLRNSPL